MKYSLRSLMIVMLVLPPLLAVVWFALQRKDMREMAIVGLAALLINVFGLLSYFGVYRLWNYRR